MTKTNDRIQAALCGNEAFQLDRVFSQGRRDKMEAETQLFPEYVSTSSFASQRGDLENTQVMFSTWGMDEELARLAVSLPHLKAFFYAAGTVHHFAHPLLERNIVVVSSWAANAVPVSQFAFSQILLSLKGYFQNVRETRKLGNRGSLVATEAPGVYSETVALLGCGMVSQLVSRLLRPLDIEVLVYDPYLSDSAATELGVRKVSLAAAFSTAMVVSNHLPDLSATRGSLNRTLFASMRKGATFVNTGRGATVVESELIDCLRLRPDLSALLDVTYPEPPAPNSPLYNLDNVHLSSHIAGSNGNEVVRMADYCLQEFRLWKAGQPLKYRVTEDMLANMA